MCRGRQSRTAQPTGIGEPIANTRPPGPIGVGAARFVGSDGNITQSGGRTSAEELTRLRSQLNPVDRLKREAQDRILQYLNISSNQFVEAQEIIGLTRAALGGSVIATVKVAVSMLMAGVDAMYAGQTQRDCLCAAYTFGYWVFKDRDPDLRAPTRPPNALHQSDVEEDSHENYDGISASLKARRWRTCHNETLSQLNNSLNTSQMRTDLMRRFGMDLSRSTDVQILQNYKLMILTAEFSNDPRLAASTFFLATIPNLDSTTERSVATLLYRRYPYDSTT